MDGVELADSVCWDAHKMMGLPLVCSAFLIKKPEILRKLCAHGNVANYLFLGGTEDVDLGRTSLQWAGEMTLEAISCMARKRRCWLGKIS